MRGLIINNFDTGIRLTSDNTIVAGSFIGTDATGTTARPNNTGILIGGSSTGGANVPRPANNTIGGTAAADRNLISGNGRRGISINGPNNSVLGMRSA